MKSGKVFGRGATIEEVMTPPGNPWLREVSADRVALPQGVRIVRNSSDLPAVFDRHARLRAAKEKLRDFMDIE